MYPTIGSSSVAFSDFSSAFPRHAGTQLTQESSSRRRCSAMLAEKTSSSSSGNRRSFCSRCFSALLATTTRSCSCKSSDFSALAETASGCLRVDVRPGRYSMDRGAPQPSAYPTVLFSLWFSRAPRPPTRWSAGAPKRSADARRENERHHHLLHSLRIARLRRPRTDVVTQKLSLSPGDPLPPPLPDPLPV